MDRIPAGQYILTAAFDGARSGVPVSWVQQCSDTPPMVMVAVRKGRPIDPLIRDSRAFALCQVGRGERYLSRKFSAQQQVGDDPFLSTPTRSSPSGCPVLERAIAYMDCELVRHVDIESDFELFVGLVHHADVLSNEAPEITRPTKE